MKSSPHRSKRTRTLGWETLEDRRLLSLSAAEYAAIGADYSEFNLPASQASIGVIELTSPTLESLNAAITSSAASPGRDLVVLRTDSVHSSLILTGSALTFNFDVDASGELAIVALGEAMTISAGGKSSILNVASGSVQFGNLRLMGGYAANGGAFYAANGSTLVLKNCEISASAAASSGGGIYNAGTMTLIDSRITENVAFVNGGGLYNAASGTANLLACVIAGNDALASGGGIFSRGTLALGNSVVAGNQAAKSGGGISSSSVTMANVSVVGNDAGTYGGGLYSCGSATVNNSILAFNKAVYGVDLYTSTSGIAASVNYSLLLKPDTGTASVSDASFSNLYYQDPEFVLYNDYLSWNSAN